MSLSSVDISLAIEKKIGQTNDEAEPKFLVTPGDVITRDAGFMRGHGTYMGTDDVLYASVAGVVDRVNKLISVLPLKTRYNGEIGDVVVGRIVEVQQKRWRVDTNSRLDSVLALASVNLPGGELRRRGAEDELSMRKYLNEGDLISAEVQNIYHDGSLSLHTRSLKYGKLGQGCLLKVSPSLVKRRKTHFHQLPCGASIILGNNGFIWISPTQGGGEMDTSEGGGGGFTQNLEVVPESERETIARLRNVVLCLAENCTMLWDTSIMYAWEASTKYSIPELLNMDAMRDVAHLTQQRLQMDME
eukprot:TRINITY_DN1969_c0_g1_i4.p1 TRINITY_DN1969_c0_g1~~TRINITY_DN1969_c0_g1_i4.p1  ORF type:complete len:302 (-),score=46.55 TRINITY_DN1969_c0_g1_i4:281-1186(-)